MKKGRFLVNNLIWNLFYRTGNIETYLLLKELENEQLREENRQNNDKLTHETKW